MRAAAGDGGGAGRGRRLAAVRLTFLGTRGYIDARTRRHRRHSALMVAGPEGRLMIDCGADWRDRLAALAPDAVIVTHAHPDHAFGLDRGAPCPVYATRESWTALADFPIEDRHTLSPRRRRRICGLSVQPFPVIHSLRAPAVGYRIGRGRTCFFYVPDVIAIRDRRAALNRALLFIGDGATLTRPMVRRRGTKLFGHTTVRAQLGWCAEEGVPRAIFTHCGSEIVTGDERRLGPKLRAMARERGVEAEIAHDGLEIELGPSGARRRKGR